MQRQESHAYCVLEFEDRAVGGAMVGGAPRLGFVCGS